MLKRLFVVPVAVAAGLAVAPSAGAAGPPTAQMSGGDVVPPLPSLVQTRLTRVDKALERLTEDVDDVDVHVAKSSKTVRRQLWAAWRGARYYIAHPPAPPAEDAHAHRRRPGVRVRDLAPKVRAKITQDDEGPVIADPVTTGMAVFDAFHQVSSTVIELTDGARVPVLDAMSRTLFLSLDRRDRAVEDVHTLAPPAPPEAEDASVHAKAAQDEDAAVTFDTTMPTLPVFFDDEIQHIDGLLSDAPDLRPGGRRILNKGRAQITATETKVNTYWPPVVDD
jgi:hypothetical protein